MITIRYNLFRNREREDLCCAVPEDHAVPGFVTNRDWSFSGPLASANAPRGFDARAAAGGVQLNGFYVFQEVRPTLSPATGASEQAR
jgi:hypothetical protein